MEELLESTGEGKPLERNTGLLRGRREHEPRGRGSRPDAGPAAVQRLAVGRHLPGPFPLEPLLRVDAHSVVSGPFHGVKGRLETA